MAGRVIDGSARGRGAGGAISHPREPPSVISHQAVHSGYACGQVLQRFLHLGVQTVLYLQIGVLLRIASQSYGFECSSVALFKSMKAVGHLGVNAVVHLVPYVNVGLHKIGARKQLVVVKANGIVWHAPFVVGRGNEESKSHGVAIFSFDVSGCSGSRFWRYIYMLLPQASFVPR